MPLPKKYDLVARELEKEIAEASGPSSERKLAGVNELAQKYHTSIATMTKALDLLEQRQWIRRLPGKGIFVRETPLVRMAVVFDSPEEQLDFTFSAVFCRLARAFFAERNIGFREFFNVSDQAGAEYFADELDRSKFDLVLVASAFVAKNHRRIFRKSDALVIGLYDYKELENTVGFDSAQWVTAAARELQKSGCPVVTAIVNDYSDTWRKRPGMVEAGLATIQQPRGVIRQKLSMQGGYLAGLELMQKFSARPLGIICTDSLMTLGLFQAVISARLRIPEDVMIATHLNSNCYINIPLLPVITYVAPIEKMLDVIIAEFRKFQQDRNYQCGDFVLEMECNRDCLDQYWQNKKE